MISPLNNLLFSYTKEITCHKDFEIKYLFATPNVKISIVNLSENKNILLNYSNTVNLEEEILIGGIDFYKAIYSNPKTKPNSYLIKLNEKVKKGDVLRVKIEQKKSYSNSSYNKFYTFVNCFFLYD